MAFDFSSALYAAQHGEKISRSDWGPGGGRNRHVFMIRGVRVHLPTPLSARGYAGDDVIIPEAVTVEQVALDPFLVVLTSDGHYAPYTPSQEDLLAKDWLGHEDRHQLEMKHAEERMQRDMKLRAEVNAAQMYQGLGMMGQAPGQRPNDYSRPIKGISDWKT